MFLILFWFVVLLEFFLKASTHGLGKLSYKTTNQKRFKNFFRTIVTKFVVSMYMFLLLLGILGF